MAAGNIPQTGGLNDILAMLQNFSGTNASTARRTTGDQTTAGSTNTIQDLLSTIAGNTQQQTTQQQTGSQASSQTTSGSNRNVQTTRSDITQEGINRMLQTTLEADGGIASIFSGQNQAGGYGSTTSGMLASDLIARTAGELARLQAGTTVTTEGTQGQTVTGSQTNTQNTTGTQNQTNNQTTTQRNTTDQTQNQTVNSNQQVNEDLRRDAPLDPMNVLGLLAGGTVLGPSLGQAAGGLGQLGTGLADLLRGLGIFGGGGNESISPEQDQLVGDLIRAIEPGGNQWEEDAGNVMDIFMGMNPSEMLGGVDLTNWDLGF